MARSDRDSQRQAPPCSFQTGSAPAPAYREVAPSPQLAPYLVCAWTLSVAGTHPGHQQQVLPDGCSDIVWVGDAEPIVVGPMTRSAPSVVAPGTSLLGLRFRPGVAASIFGAPASELADREVPLRELWHRLADDVTSQLDERRSTRGKFAALEQALGQHCRAIASPDPIVSAALARITQARTEPIEELAAALAISPRHLRRRFVAAVGYGPKTFQGILRFQRLLALANAPTAARRRRPRRLDDLAMVAGYADQAHMTREVRRFAGVTPAALLGNVESALILSDLLGEPPTTSASARS